MTSSELQCVDCVVHF